VNLKGPSTESMRYREQSNMFDDVQMFSKTFENRDTCIPPALTSRELSLVPPEALPEGSLGRRG